MSIGSQLDVFLKHEGLVAEAEAAASKRVRVSVAESVRIVRELQELTQTRLAELTGIPRSTISAIENGRMKLNVERAEVLACALQVHPAVLVLPTAETGTENDC
ncbi:MAG: helix-turn-helix domain-containing protein [Candidatus Wenzhouxiangella sp. M2_3B_020]